VYLKSIFDHKKQLNPGFSHRLLARQLGLKAPGHMLFVMRKMLMRKKTPLMNFYGYAEVIEK